MGIFNRESYEEKCERLQREYDEKQAKLQKELEEQQEKERLEKEKEQEMLRLREGIKNTRSKKLVYSCQFQSGTKTVVDVYENRIEFTHTSISSVICNGVTGRMIMYFKNLSAIEMTYGTIQFISSGFFHIERELNKSKVDNVIRFSNNEIDLATELIDVINDLM